MDAIAEAIGTAVQALLDDAKNLELCALILAEYAAHWRAANPAWAIDHKPEILATLFQIGFERSHPKPDPKPNEFGLRVRAAYDSPELVALFPDQPPE